MVSANIKAFIVEGLIIGIIISSMTTTTTYLAELITGDREDRRVHWVANISMGIIGHVIAETFRHDRIVDLLSVQPKFVPITGPMKRKSALMGVSFDDLNLSKNL